MGTDKVPLGALGLDGELRGFRARAATAMLDLLDWGLRWCSGLLWERTTSHIRFREVARVPLGVYGGFWPCSDSGILVSVSDWVGVGMDIVKDLLRPGI